MSFKNVGVTGLKDLGFGLNVDCFRALLSAVLFASQTGTALMKVDAM